MPILRSFSCWKKSIRENETMKKLTDRQNRALIALKNRPFVFWKCKRKFVGANRGYPMNVMEALVSKGYATEHVENSQVVRSNILMGNRIRIGNFNFDRRVTFKAIPEEI